MSFEGFKPLPVDFDAWRPAEPAADPMPRSVARHFPARVHRSPKALTTVPDVNLSQIPLRLRVLYIVLGIFLGLLGIHNFYAARYRAGFAQLLTPLFAGLLIFIASWMFGGSIREEFAMATASLDSGKPAITAPARADGPPLGPSILLGLGLAGLVAMPIWVIADLIFVTRDGYNRKMV